MGKLKLSEVSEKLWTYLMVDFITKLPVLAGKDAILVVCDRLSKNDIFCSNNRRDISRRFGKVVQRQRVEAIWITGECDVG